jgi:uncharacterized phage infection (PIP) family protein YhgE
MRRALVLLTLIVALVASGCGGDSNSKATTKDEYGQQLAQAGQTLQKTFADIADQTGSSTSSAQIADRLDKGATALDDAAKKFAEITPPSEVKGAHQKFVDGFKELAGVFRKGADAARKNDTTTLTKALQGLTTSDGVKKITEAQKELETKGITVPTTSSGS